MQQMNLLPAARRPQTTKTIPRLATSHKCCFIHVGTHKTGTTSIQAFLRDNQERFAEHGVIIPRAGRGEDAAGHHNLTQQLLGDSGFVAEWGGLQEVVDELRHSERSIACLSSEDFSLVSRSRNTLVAIRDTIAATGFTPVIVLYLRPQISYCVSIYAEIVKNGYRKPFATYLEEVAQHGSFLWNGAAGPLCRYDVLLERFATVFGERSLIVRRYRATAPNNALLKSFARLLIGEKTPLNSFLFPPERFNRSLSFQRVLDALGSDSQVLDMRFAPMDLHQTLSLAAPFYRANRSVARRYGVWVPPYELNDLLLALPLRKTYARSVDLVRARRALRAFVKGSTVLS
jgi:hypothetical protein